MRNADAMDWAALTSGASFEAWDAAERYDLDDVAREFGVDLDDEPGSDIDRLLSATRGEANRDMLGDNVAGW